MEHTIENTTEYIVDTPTDRLNDFSTPLSHLTIKDAKKANMAYIFYMIRLSPWSVFRITLEKLLPQTKKSLYDEIKNEFGIDVNSVIQAINVMVENDKRHIKISCVSDDVLQSFKEEGISSLPYKVSYVGPMSKDALEFKGVRIKMTPEHMDLAEKIRSSYWSPNPLDSSEIVYKKMNSDYSPYIFTGSIPFTMFWRLAVENGAVEIYGIGGKKICYNSPVEWSVLF